MRGRQWRRATRGQAAVEFAVVAPLIISISLGVAGFSTFGSYSAIGAAQARVGLYEGVSATGTGALVNAAILNETGNVDINNTTDWGNGALAAGDCAIGTGDCGDTFAQACSPSSTWWTSSSVRACYSLGACTLSSCTPGAWGTKLAPASASQMVVRVTIRFRALTPSVTNFANGGFFYVTQTVIGTPLY